MDVEMIVPSHLAGLTQVLGSVSNYCSASNSCYTSKPAAIYCPYHNPGSHILFNTLHQIKVKKWYTAMSPEEISELSHNLVVKVEYFISGMTATGLEYDTPAAIREGMPEYINLGAYC